MNDQTEELKKDVEDWAAAELRGNTAFLGSALADDFVGVGPRGFMLTKEQWLERNEAGKLKYKSFQLNDAQVRLYGGAAVVIGRETAEGRYEDRDVRHDIREQFRATLVSVKQQGRWLLAGLQLSPILGRP